MSNPLERLEDQRAMQLLQLLQSDLRAQMREDADDRALRLAPTVFAYATPAEREATWEQGLLPSYHGKPIRSLPKRREFWASVDITSFSRAALDAACDLLDLKGEGKKQELVARILDWVHEPQLRQQQLELESKKRAESDELSSGRVFAFGHNFNGELGLGHRRPMDSVVEIESLKSAKIVRVFSGFDASFACATTSDGEVYCWGAGSHVLQSLLIHEKPTQEKTSSSSTLFPHRLSHLSSKKISSVTAARASGECYTWGSGEYGELGRGDLVRDASLPPRPISLPKKVRVSQISVGNCHSAALTSDGQLYTWGGCWNGQLGLGELKRAGVKDRKLQLCFPSPTLVESLASTVLTQVSCGAVHTGVVSNTGSLYMFGCGDGGRLGLGHNQGSPHPELVSSLKEEHVLDVCCSSWHTMCLVTARNRPKENRSGYVYSFGTGTNGQLGLGKQKSSALPTRIPALFHRKQECTAIAASSYHSCALTSEGTVYTWGRNASGCLGHKTPDLDAPEPNLVELPTDWSIGPVTSVAVGDRLTIVLTAAVSSHTKESFEVKERVNRHKKHEAVPSHVRI